uniref:Nuclease associated modular domain-containing protein n=1 Tax=viral metagenome TaxID=1070528 RepID=A0A6M3IJ15_9ZZZZ
MSRLNRQKFCACGCGSLIISKDQKVIIIHNHFTKEMRYKISKSKIGKGHPCSEETKKKLSKVLKGRKAWWIKPWSDEARRKMSISKIGPLNPNWKGGTWANRKRGGRFNCKGIKRSEETKRKMSISKIGSKNPNFGKTYTNKEKAHLSHKFSKNGNPNWGGGKFVSCQICGEKVWKGPKSNVKTCGRRCGNLLQSINTKGSGASNWQGGISCLPYPFEFNKKLKKEISVRDHYKCQNPLCRNNSKKFGVHHIDYNKKNIKFRNLIYLCFSCNTRANFDRTKWKNIYSLVIKEKYELNRYSINI